MKKKIFSIILALLLCLPCFILLTACGNNKQACLDKLELSYIKNLKIDMSGKQGLSIKKVNCDIKRVNTISANVLLSFSNIAYAAGNETTEKYMLFTTTQSYTTGNVTYNENSIEKVTFTKNESVTEDVYDSEGNIISSNTELTQEEIPGQINRLYVFGDYTFLQFVPLLESSGSYNYYDANGNLQSEYIEMRPNILNYDINGVAEFDKGNYYSSALSQSFVIDNNTGYIYKIENFVIENITETGIITQRNPNNTLDGYNTNYYKMYIDGRNLVFLDVTPNKDLSVHGVVQDKYGWVFVNNDLLNQKDEQNKIIYYKSDDYHYIIDANNEVYLCEYRPNTSIDTIKKKIENGIECDVSSDIIVYDVKYISNNGLNPCIAFYKGYFVWGRNGNFGVENSIWGTTESYWFDSTISTIVSIENNYLYVKKINIDDYLGTNTHLTTEGFTKMSDDKLYKKNKYYIDIDGNKKEVDNVYYKVTTNSTTYYQLVKNGNTFELIQLSDINYTQNVFIFQPINK